MCYTVPVSKPERENDADPSAIRGEGRQEMEDQEMYYDYEAEMRLRQEEEWRQSIFAEANKIAEGFKVDCFMETCDWEISESFQLTEEEFHSMLDSCFHEDMKQALLKWAIMICAREFNDESINMNFIFWFIPAFLYRYYKDAIYCGIGRIKKDFEYFLESVSGRKPYQEELNALYSSLIDINNNIIRAMSHL